jgi:flagellar export protein FliJ
VRGLEQWRRLLESDVRTGRIGLARARLAVERAEQVAALLSGERDRRDAHERERRREGEMPDFTRERLNVLLERAIVRARGKVADVQAAAFDASERLREAWRRETVVDRLLARRREREAAERLARDQREHDELASLRHYSGVLADAESGSGGRRQNAAQGGDDR